MRYGDVLPEGFDIPTSAFWIRKDLTDAGNPFKLVNIRKGDVIMDCGAFIGTFAAAALEQGAKMATCYEASPKNAILLRKNMKRHGSKVNVEEAALVADRAGHVMLTLSGFSGANSILPSPNRKKSVKVKALNFRKELIHLEPDVIKLDVEGAEYDLLDSLRTGDLISVRCVFIEFHPIEEREERIRAISDFLTEEGFSIIATRKRAFVATKETA